MPNEHNGALFLPYFHPSGHFFVVLRIRHGSVHIYASYDTNDRMVLVCVILGHLILALWEGGKSPFPLHLPVAAAELVAFLFYTTHVLLNLWTFGVKQYRWVR